MNDLEQCISKLNHWENWVKYIFLASYVCNALLVATTSFFRYLKPQYKHEYNKEEIVETSISMFKAFILLFYNLIYYAMLLPVDENTNYSLIYTIVRYIYTCFKLESNEMLVELKRTTKKQITFFALRNPLTFYYEVRRVLFYIRWLNFLAPLIGILNKLIGNVTDLRKKWKQSQERKRAKLIREKMCIRTSGRNK